MVTAVTDDQGGSAVGLAEVDVRLGLSQRKGRARIIEVRRTGLRIQDIAGREAVKVCQLQ